MSMVFISHASCDKEIVRRLAVDLINEGFPVWLDEWELEVGESLINRIYGAVAESTFFVLVMSEASVRSGWVAKELNAALIMEERLGRKFLIPVLINDCEIPLQIADRLYADFSRNYLSALQDVAGVLRSVGAFDAPTEPSKTLLPLKFMRGIHLDTHAFQRRVEGILDTRPADFRFSPDSIIIVPEKDYVRLRQALAKRLENVETDPYFSAEFARSLSVRYQLVLGHERKLKAGIALILNELTINRSATFCSYGDVCRWFALFWRSAILHILWSSQSPDSAEQIEFGQDCIWCESGSDPRFYGLSSLGKVDIGPAEDNCLLDSFGAWLDEESAIYKDIWYKGIPILMPVSQAGIETMSKFIVPQMVSGLIAGHSGPFTWDFEGYRIGRG